MKSKQRSAVRLPTVRQTWTGIINRLNNLVGEEVYRYTEDGKRVEYLCPVLRTWHIAASLISCPYYNDETNQKSRLIQNYYDYYGDYNV